MRNRTFTPPFAEEEPFDTDFDTPINVPFLQMDYWCFRVRTWWMDAATLNSDGAASASGEVGWNYNNELYTKPPTAATPAHEGFLGMGWCMNGVGVSNGAGVVASMNLFYPKGPSGAGYGYWNDSGTLKPYLTVATSTTTSRRTGTSALSVTIDGITVPMYNVTLATTGTITITPYSFWEYKKSDLTNPMYNATTGAVILGRQTDEPL